MSVICGNCNAEYVFMIKYGSVTTIVNPMNFLETSLVDELETDQIFYRRKFQGTLTFGGRGNKADFDYLWAFESSDPCTRLDFTIYRNGVIYWLGYFSTSLGSWDLDECTFQVTPLVKDDYVELLDKADLEYNLLASEEIAEVTCNYDNGIAADDTAYTHCRMVVDVVEYILEQMLGYHLDVTSTFFESANNPVTLTTNHYNYLTIAQKSDIKNPLATNPATVGMMSFNQIMTILRCMNLYWDYDGTEFIIEHVSYWPENTGIDIRSQKICRGTNKYRYLNEQMPKYEKFAWMESGNVDFIGDPIWYDSECVNQDPDTNVIEYDFNNVTTDLQYIRDCVADSDSEPLISNNGWVILANELRGADLYVWFNVNSALSELVCNIDMSWYYLHNCFWKHDRQLIIGNMNGNLTTFYTARKIKQQECSIVYCNPWGEEFDPTDYLTTELGETYFGGEKAKVKKSLIKPQGQIDLTLIYGPADNANPGITYDKVFFGVEVQTDTNESTVYGILSEAAPVGGITIQFKIQIKDTIGGTCKTDFQTIAFAAGEYKANSGAIAWCDPGGGAPYCIDEFTDVTASVAGWLSYFEISTTSTC